MFAMPNSRATLTVTRAMSHMATFRLRVGGKMKSAASEVRSVEQDNQYRKDLSQSKRPGGVNHPVLFN